MTTTLMDSFLSVCLKTLNLTYTTSEFLIYGTHTKIKSKLDELDITNKIEIISEFIKENQSNINKFKSLKLAVSRIMEIVKQINVELENINKECANFEQRWFTYWRSPDCDAYFNKLEQYCFIFNERCKLLFQCINSRHL